MKYFDDFAMLRAMFPAGVILVRVVHSFRARQDYLEEFGHRDLPTWELRPGFWCLFVPVRKRELLDWLAGER
jgi:hypothetical protein